MNATKSITFATVWLSLLLLLNSGERWLAFRPTIHSMYAEALATACTETNQCAVFHDPFCFTNTSLFWLEHANSAQSRTFGTGPSCTTNYRMSFYGTKALYNVVSPVTHAVFLKARVTQLNRTSVVVAGFRQTPEPDITTLFDASSLFVCTPGAACQIASRQGYLKRKPDTFDRNLPVKVAVQTVGNKTLHWAIYNNDTEFIIASSIYRLNAAEAKTIEPGYALSGGGGQPASTCADDFTVLDPNCSPGCDTILDSHACIQRTECMWYQDSCISYTSCPFDLEYSPLFCFDDTCDFHNPAGLDGECCDAIVVHCANNPDDLGCDCELLGFRCPQLACDSATFTPPPELCAATVYPVTQKTKRCQPGLTSVVLEIPSSTPVQNPMCSVLVEEYTGLRCISEPCLYPPSAVSGNTITCDLSKEVLSNDLTLQVYALQAHPVTDATTAACPTAMLQLSLATHGAYSAQCESCELGRVGVLDYSPKCNLYPDEQLTLHLLLAPLEDPISCRFWRRTADGGEMWVSPDGWETPIMYSTQDTVVCRLPSTYIVGIETYITVLVEGYYPNCARFPAADPSGTTSLNTGLHRVLPATCQSCDFEADISISTGEVLTSPCEMEACSDLVATATHSETCCNAIFDFCKDASCTCTEVASAGCSVASSCSAHPGSTLIGTCNPTDVAVQVTAVSGTVLTLFDKLPADQFFQLLQERIFVLGIPKDDITCVYVTVGPLSRSTYLFIHFATKASALVFEEALRTQLYTLFDGTSLPTSTPTSAPPPRGLTLGVQLGIAFAVVLALLGMAGTMHQRHKAKRTALSRTADREYELGSVSGPNGPAMPFAKASKQTAFASIPQAHMNDLEPQFDRTQSPPSFVPTLNCDALARFYFGSYQKAVCETLGASTIHLAAALGDDEMVNTVVTSPVFGGKSMVSATDARGQTPLIWACQFSRSPGTVQLLIKHGSPVNHQDLDGMTALHHACRCGHVGAVEALLCAGADPFVPDANGDVAIHYASHTQHATELIEILLRHQSLSQVVDCHGRTLLIRCVIDGNTALRKILLKHSVQAELSKGQLVWIDMPDTQGWTALHWAARLNDVEAVEELLEAGADMRLKDVCGNTPLHLAVEEGSVGVALVLGVTTSHLTNLAGNTPRSMVDKEVARLRDLQRRHCDSAAQSQLSSSLISEQTHESTPLATMIHDVPFTELDALQLDLGDFDSTSATDALQLPPLNVTGGSKDQDSGHSSEPSSSVPSLLLDKALSELQHLLAVFDNPELTRERRTRWIGSQKQRLRNKAACRLRRTRDKEKDDELGAFIASLEQRHEVIRGVLATLQRDRQELQSVLDTDVESSFV
eukprot:m.343718 g.343718  ORF g.343718 m.343718 type:complete len:1341 (+) comp16131_c0_seq8:190-4212(+)